MLKFLNTGDKNLINWRCFLAALGLVSEEPWVPGQMDPDGCALDMPQDGRGGRASRIFPIATGTLLLLLSSVTTSLWPQDSWNGQSIVWQTSICQWLQMICTCWTRTIRASQYLGATKLHSEQVSVEGKRLGNFLNKWTPQCGCITRGNVSTVRLWMSLIGTTWLITLREFGES